MQAKSLPHAAFPMLRLFAALALAFALLPMSRAQSLTIRSITPSVAISVTSGSFNLSTGAASVAAPSAIASLLRSTNRSWSLSVRSTTSTFSHTPATGAPLTSKSVSSLLIRRSGTTPYLAISTSDTAVATGPVTTNSGTPVNFDLRFDTSLSDSPGQYSALLVFTLFTL